MQSEQSQIRVDSAIEISEISKPIGKLAVKRAIDVVAALLALLLLGPLLIAISIAIKLDSPGQVVFRQKRGGLHGRPFYIYKFRTLRAIEDGSSIAQVTRHDPRATRIGRILRRTSLDELPQLLNVLLGDMSLVGPRPHALAHDNSFGRVIPNYSQRFAVRPGITGWAQVCGARGPTPHVSDMQRRVDLDVWYVENLSLALDARILLMTLFRWLTGKMEAF